MKLEVKYTINLSSSLKEYLYELEDGSYKYRSPRPIFLLHTKDHKQEIVKSFCKQDLDTPEIVIEGIVDDLLDWSNVSLEVKVTNAIANQIIDCEFPDLFKVIDYHECNNIDDLSGLVCAIEQIRINKNYASDLFEKDFLIEDGSYKFNQDDIVKKLNNHRPEEEILNAKIELLKRRQIQLTQEDLNYQFKDSRLNHKEQYRLLEYLGVISFIREKYNINDSNLAILISNILDKTPKRNYLNAINKLYRSDYQGEFESTNSYEALLELSKRTKLTDLEKKINEDFDKFLETK